MVHDGLLVVLHSSRTSHGAGHGHRHDLREHQLPRPWRQRAGLKPGAIETADDYYLLRLRDPDGNLVVLASARRV